MHYFTRAWDIINNTVVHVKGLPKQRNGLKCGCSCVECKEMLEACQGEKRSWYFRHLNKSNCIGGPMTALHLLAQQILEGNQTIKTKEGFITYTDGIKEYKRADSSFRFDIGAKKEDNTDFIIEVWVNHSNEIKKDEYLKSNKIPSIEIDLSTVDPNIDEKELRHKLLNEISLQRSIFMPSKKSNWVEEIVPFAIFFGIRWFLKRILTK